MENSYQAKPLRRENGKQRGAALRTIRTRANVPTRNQDRNGQNFFYEPKNIMHFFRGKTNKNEKISD